MKKFLLLIIVTLACSANAESVKTIIEFFSFNCSHCANVNQKLAKYIKKNNIKYLDINIDKDSNAMTTNIAYYIAIDAGVGQAFKSTYFEAVNNGMPIYTSTTLKLVIDKVKNPKMKEIMKSAQEKEHITQKLNYVQSLINQYQPEVTPTFVINQTTMVAGEDVINSMLENNND